MADDGLEILPAGIPFDEAVQFLRQKIELPTRTWTDLWEGMHSRAFVVAGAMQAELVADFHQAVTDAIAQGESLEQFRARFDEIVRRHGWSYRGSRGWRSAVIYNTNLRTAQSAGRWQQAARAAARAAARGETLYIRYRAVLDTRTRPQHRNWHDVILPFEHKFWRSHFPPNGWNCRCTVQILTESQMRRRGLRPTPPDQVPPTAAVPARIRSADGGRIVETPQGIDPGFGYNPGIAGYGRGAELSAMEAHGRFTALQSPFGNRPSDPEPLSPRPAPSGLGATLGPDPSPDALYRAWTDAIGAGEVILTDPTGARVRLSPAVVDHILEDLPGRGGREAFFPLIPELVTDPQEVWVGFAESQITGRVLMRRRYVRAFELEDGGTAGALITDFDGGFWAGFNFIPFSNLRETSARTGLRIYQAPAGG